MTVVYPLTAQLDHTELKYSLRSIEKYLTPPFEVVIVGDIMPDWISNVTQIALPDVPGQAQISVRRKVIAALHYAEEIFFMNDDIYLLEPTDPLNFVHYSSGYLTKMGESGARPALKQLTDLGKLCKYFGHYPAVYKRDFEEVLSRFSNDCITKSAYCNFVGVKTIEIADCKLISASAPALIRNFIKDKPCFSTGIRSLKHAVPILDELYPEKSQYEI